MPALVKDVVVVGGGTAGWLSALHIKATLGESARVALIESPDVPTIGVGEGTQPTIRVQLGHLAIDEAECLRECGASFKNGIRFVGWCGGDGPEEYLHPFFSSSTRTTKSPFVSYHIWLGQYHRGQVGRDTLADLCFPESALIRHKRAPLRLTEGQQGNTPLVNYAYHVDAARLGLYLQKVAIARGVRHITDHVEGIRRTEHGNIASVVTREHGDIYGQFFIDCTGFRRLLIGTLDDHYVSFDPFLFNDRAVTARIPYSGDGPVGIESCTVSTALTCGWVWEVPLYNRLGTGYVYSSRFIRDSEAERELVRFLGTEPEQTNLIRFRTGYYSHPWKYNCVAIGLSGGFIEPLEATGIALITYSLYRLLELWPADDSLPALRDRFNRVMQHSYEWVRDFVVMHYCFSQRTDSEYWRAVQRADAVPDSVKEWMEILEHGWPFGDVSEPSHGYRLPDASIVCVLAGFLKIPRLPNCYVAGLRPEELDASMAEMSARTQKTLLMCPDHADSLRGLHARRLGSRK